MPVPIAIQSQAWALSGCSISRPSTARPMARAARPLAERAVLTFESPLMPSASSNTATRSIKAGKRLGKAISVPPRCGTICAKTSPASGL